MADATQDPFKAYTGGKTPAGANQEDSQAPLPKGVVLDKDGKP